MPSVSAVKYTKVTPRRPVPRACALALRRERPASNARAVELGPRTAMLGREFVRAGVCSGDEVMPRKPHVRNKSVPSRQGSSSVCIAE
eukprot:2528857-Pleurochrysis_carterae.AAC.1